MIAYVSNAKVVAVSGGLTVEAAAKLGASVLVRGVRNATDFEYEATFASHNRVQNGEVETVLCSVRKEISLCKLFDDEGSWHVLVGDVSPLSLKL